MGARPNKKEAAGKERQEAVKKISRRFSVGSQKIFNLQSSILNQISY